MTTLPPIVLQPGDSITISAAPTFVAPPPPPPPPPPPITGTPPDRAALTYVASPAIPAVPAMLSPVADPTWGTHVTRVSNVNGVTNEYSRSPAWNADQSLILLPGPGSSSELHDGTTYAKVRGLPRLPGYAHWAYTDPNKIFGTYNGDPHFYACDARTDAMSVVHNFSGYSEVSLGDGEGNVSDDDKTVALMTKSAAGNGALVYDLASGNIVATVNWGSSRPNNVSVSHSGQFVIVSWGPDGSGLTQGLWLYSRLLVPIRQLTMTARHGDHCLDSAGHDLWVQCTNGVEMWRLDDGTHPALNLPKPNAFEYGHLSGRNVGRPGWAYLSTYDWGSTSGRPGRDQLVAIKLDGSGTVEVFGFANHRSTSYSEQPHATPSRDGKRVCFNSEWGAPGTVYAYVAGL